MDCKKINKLIPLFIDGAVPEENKKEIQEHLLICQACKKYAEALHNQKKRIKEAVQSCVMPEYLPENISLMLKKFVCSKYKDLLKSKKSIALIAAILIVAIGLLIAINKSEKSISIISKYKGSNRNFSEVPKLSKISGKIVCIGCELRKIYGAPIYCKQGHKFVLKTSEGNYLNYEAADYIKEFRWKGIYGCEIEVVGYIYEKQHFVNIIALNYVKKK